jgi:hypothetical protein
MKKINLLRGVLYSLLICFSITSCSSSNDDNDNTNNTLQSSIENSTQSGTWRITKFIDSGIDETGDFLDYNFTFNNVGTLNASNGTNNFEGSWNISSVDGVALDDLELNLLFTLRNDFDDLTDDWDFISQTSTKIELIDISGGGEPNDLLTFEKN